MIFFKFLNSAFLLILLLACNGMGKDEIPNFKYKDASNYYFKIGNCKVLSEIKVRENLS